MPCQYCGSMYPSDFGWGGPGYGMAPGWGGGPTGGPMAGPMYGPAQSPFMGTTPWDYYGYGSDWYTPTTWDDDDIRMAVEDNIASDWVVSREDFENIGVEVEDGIVTLSGEVHDRRTKHHAYSAAFWTTGVIDVINNIGVREKERGKERKRTTRGKGRGKRAR